MWYDVLLDALLDTLKLVPFLFLMYILIELMEHNTRVGKPSRLLTGRAAPLVGTATGLVPMCGFSVMAAKLYEHRHLTLGALLAVFIATSDEGLLVLLLSSETGFLWTERLYSILGLLGAKLALGVAIGYLVDAFYRRTHSTAPLPEHVHDHGEHPGVEHQTLPHVHDRGDGGEAHTANHDPAHAAHMAEHAHAEGEHAEDEAAHEHGECACDELTVCEHKHPSTLKMYLVSPLLHTLQVAAFVLLVNLAFGFLFFGVGEARVVGFLQGAGYWYQPLICPLIGLIPNCASSVVLAETFALHGIGFGGLLGGLVSNAGLGYLVLFRKRSGLKAALAIIFAMYALGAAVGYAANALALLI